MWKAKYKCMRSRACSSLQLDSLLIYMWAAAVHTNLNRVEDSGQSSLVPSFSMLHAEKREGLVRERTCVMPLGVIPRTYKKVTSCSREGSLFQATNFKRKVYY